MIIFSKRIWLLAALLLLPSLPTIAADVASSELVGKFGFDWLKPEKAKCQALTATTLTGVKSCKYMKAGDTGSFTGQADFYVCKVSGKSEYMVYKTQARCAEELETMQSNGP